MIKPSCKYTKYEKLLALSHFLNNYHSGQWSKGYRYLCLSLKALRKMGIDHPIDIRLNDKQYDLYNYLIDKYQNEV